jgi:hypothetical protein
MAAKGWSGVEGLIGDKNVLQLTVLMVHNSVNVLKTIDSYTLNR